MFDKAFSLTIKRVLLVALIWPCLANPEPVSAGIVHKSGHIASDETWSAGNVYAVDGHVTVDMGVTLTIEAGAVVKVADGRLIGVNGVLKLQGDASNPVYITSLKDDSVGGDTNGDGYATAPAPGDWGHIAFLESSVDAENIIEHAVVRYGGHFYTGSSRDYYDCYQCTYTGSIRFHSSSPTVRNCVIEHSEGYALSASVDSFPVASGNTLVGNVGNGLEIRGGTLSTVTPIIKHWSNTDISYVVTGHTTIGSGVTLALDPGVLLKFAGSKVMGVNGVLKVQGDASNPVYITSLKDDTVGGDTNGDGYATAPAPGDWGHIAFLESSVDAENIIEHAVVRYGGHFYTGSSRDYYDCYQCTYTGSIRFHSSSPTVRNCVIEHSEGYALSASVDSFPVASGNTLVGNVGNGLEIRGGTLSTVTPIIKHWSNTDISYVVTGHTTIGSGVTLALDPGVLLKFAGNKVMGVNGVLKVQGDASNPVYITSLKDDTVGGDTNGDGYATAPAPGDWGHIAFLESSVDAENIIEHAVVRYGGHFYTGSSRDYYDCYQCTYTGSIRFHSSSPTVRNCVIEHSEGYALSASVDSFPVASGNTLVGNVGNGLEIRGGTLSTVTPIIKHWSNTDISYVVTGHTTIGSGVTLALDPGVLLKFAGNKVMGVNGVLKLQGDASNPVYITSLKDDTVGGDTNGDSNATAPAPGDWGHIAFLESSVDAENIIEHAVVRYGGHFYTGSSRDYYDCYQCTYTGSIRFHSSSPTVRNCVIEHSEGYALSASVDSFPVASGNTLVGNVGNGLEIRGGTLSTVTPIIKHWSNTDISYVVTGHTTIGSGVTLALDPGVLLKFAGNKVMGVNGVLKVQGDASNPVYITSLKDDTVGGDTNGDGNATAPAPGDWGHIAFLDSSVDAENIIEHAVVRYGGHFFNNNDEYYDCWDCDYYGVLRLFSSSPTVEQTRLTFNKEGVVAEDYSLPFVKHNSFCGTYWYAVRQESAVRLDATLNWWGHATGPWCSSDGQWGFGDAVNANVDYIPWIATAPPATDIIRPNLGGSVISTDCGTYLTFARQSVLETTIVTYTTTVLTNLPSHLADARHSFDLQALTVTGAHTAPMTQMTIHFWTYDLTDVWSEDSLALYRWDGIKWSPIASTLDVVENTLTASILAEGQYALLGARKHRSFAPLVSVP